MATTDPTAGPAVTSERWARTTPRPRQPADGVAAHMLPRPQSPDRSPDAVDALALQRERRAAHEVLTGATDGDVQELVNLLQHVCDVEIAAVAVPRDGRFHYLATAGIDPLVCDSADTMCQHTMSVDDVVVCEDATRDARFARSPFVDGRAMDLRFYASAPLHSPGGAIVGRLCVFDSTTRSLEPAQERALRTLADSVSTVIDNRLRKRQTAAQAEAAAERAGRQAVDEMVSVASQVSHDLRVPLTALATSLGLLDESTPADESPLRRKLLASARRSVTRMTGLVDGLLRLNDVQRGLELSETDLAEVTAQVLADLAPSLDEARAHVTLGPLPTVRADADLVGVALLNLVGNALKFARPGHPAEVVVTTERLPGRLRVVVRDNGIGIPPADRERVFALFSRLTHGPGHGIGLTTVARIAEAHGGRVGVDDAPGAVGSDIWFELPA